MALLSGIIAFWFGSRQWGKKWMYQKSV
jgi:hypothetical protein